MRCGVISAERMRPVPTDTKSDRTGEAGVKDGRRARPAILRPHNDLHSGRVFGGRSVSRAAAYVDTWRCETGSSMRAVVLAFAFCCGFFNDAAAQVARFDVDGARYMRVHGQSLPPYGFVQFCQLFPQECRPGKTETQRFDASAARLAELDVVNRRINAQIQPATDFEIYGVEEFWTLPVDRGDCEDYVVLKRKVLAEMGWPISSLLITVVQDELGEGHAVLTVRTKQGDFILDNKVNEIRLWNQTPYAYIMRQSYLNPRIWVSLDPRATASPDALAGVRASR
jgi:predicted transglutaminase-like cysteine proteinase